MAVDTASETPIGRIASETSAAVATFRVAAGIATTDCMHRMAANTVRHTASAAVGPMSCMAAVAGRVVALAAVDLHREQLTERWCWHHPPSS